MTKPTFFRRNPWRSTAAVLFGIFAIVVLSLGTA